MGHIEPGGKTEGPQAIGRSATASDRPEAVRPDPLDGVPLWALWAEIMALYPLWRSILAALHPRSGFRREGSYFWFDVIRALRAMPSSQRVVGRLMSVSDDELEGLIVLGEINSKRQEHFLRSLVLAYITVPLTVGAIVAQLLPGVLMATFRNPDLAPVWGGTIAGLATAVVIRVVADWRARSFLGLLQMARAERRARPSGQAAAGSPFTLTIHGTPNRSMTEP